jgi:hypothetical protein
MDYVTFPALLPISYGKFNSESTFRSHVWRRDTPYNIQGTAFRQALFLSSKGPSLPALERLPSVKCPDLAQTTEATGTSLSQSASSQRQLPSQSASPCTPTVASRDAAYGWQILRAKHGERA